MNQNEMLQLIFEKVVSLEQGQKTLELGQASLKEEIQENRQAIRELQIEVQGNRQAIQELQVEVQGNRQAIQELQVEVQGNGHAIKELQNDVREIKHGMRFYDHKIVEHEKEIFKLKS